MIFNGVVGFNLLSTGIALILDIVSLVPVVE